MLQGHLGRVPDDLAGRGDAILLDQVGLAAGAHVLEGFAPRLHPGLLSHPIELGPQVGPSLTVVAVLDDEGLGIDAFWTRCQKLFTDRLIQRHEAGLLALMVLGLRRVDEDRARLFSKVHVLPAEVNDLGRKAKTAIPSEHQQHLPVGVSSGGDHLIDPRGLHEDQSLLVPLAASLDAYERVHRNQPLLRRCREELTAHDDPPVDGGLRQRTLAISSGGRLKKVLLEADGIGVSDRGDRTVTAEVLNQVADWITIGDDRRALDRCLRLVGVEVLSKGRRLLVGGFFQHPSIDKPLLDARRECLHPIALSFGERFAEVGVGQKVFEPQAEVIAITASDLADLDACAPTTVSELDAAGGTGGFVLKAWDQGSHY